MKVSIVSTFEMENRIIIAAQGLFLRYGIRSVTMEDIAKELGISKKTIYQHFSDKDNLVSRVTDYMLSMEQTKIEVIQKEAKNPIEEQVFNSTMMREMLENINPVLFFDIKKYHPKSWSKYLVFKKVILETVKRNLIEGIEQNLYRKEINVEVLSKLRVETVDLVFNEEYFPGKFYKILEVQLESLDHFMRGILTPVGLEQYEKTRIAN